ncbi:thrombospondin type 3 repeat-containing protein [Polyangium jinanense]|uniref:Thrombospondin type 3 repeat-containing protein n=1 Tax=Polyangium jinanense TaxID=2829994 RepID=A0A9X4AV76_9BACT|nr:thrombospondin type 3 repeat-containing protein [Polyangium jinanense]MDC3959055.1 thrombospondin type 3 repeat-containing protein [Polyangium jinanense]MDC3984022.1 thrombospondin type 3 repeat-containing protein [Polyangium jinanense]
MTKRYSRDAETCRFRGARAHLIGSTLAAAAIFATTGARAEPAECSLDPSMWPAPAKPYFLIAFDTSGSMSQNVMQAGAPVMSSCGFGSSRGDHAKCVVKNLVETYGEQVNFGLAAFARGSAMNCTSTCANVGFGDGNGTCTWQSYPGGGVPGGGCGTEPTSQPNSEDRHGGEILVPVRLDNFYAPPLEPSNVSELLQWVDNDCTQSGTMPKELWAQGETPINGLLRDAYRYLSVGWSNPTGTRSFPSPIADAGERACRPVRVLLITDGLESCDASADAVDAAADLYAGFTKGGILWSVKTHVIDFAAASLNNDAVAAAGGTGTAIKANNEAALSMALATIIEGTIGKAEVCDEADNDCNGCTDEGFGLDGPCSVGVGACERTGFLVCDGQGGTACGVAPGQPETEICGDAIDSDCDGDPSNGCNEDLDGDGVPGAFDNCADVANPDQADQDGDGEGDACDADPDGDGIPTGMGDNCPTTPNPDQADSDMDTLGDACDRDSVLDDDQDTIPDAQDVCPAVPDPDQADQDGDGVGNACDDDIDGDGLLNDVDACPLDPRLSCPNPIFDVDCAYGAGSSSDFTPAAMASILAGLALFTRRRSMRRSASRTARSTRR